MANSKTAVATKKDRLFKKLDSLKINSLKNQARTPLLFLVGMWAGNNVIVYLNKKMGEYKVTNVLGVKPEIATSIIGGVGGLALAQLANNKNFKAIGYGIAGQGMLKAVTNSSPKLKELLSGIGDNTTLPRLEDESHYLIDGPSDVLELNLDDMDEAMQIIDNAVEEEPLDEDIQGASDYEQIQESSEASYKSEAEDDDNDIIA